MISCNLKLLTEIKGIYPIDNLSYGFSMADMQVISFFAKLKFADHFCNLLDIQKSIYFEFEIQKKVFILNLLLGTDSFYKNGFDFNHFNGKAFKLNDNLFNIQDLFYILNQELNNFDSNIILKQHPYSFLSFDLSEDTKTNHSQFCSLLNNFEKLLTSIYSFKLMETSKVALFGILPDYIKRNILTKLISDQYGSNTEFLNRIKIYSDIQCLINKSPSLLYKDYELSDYHKKTDVMLSRANELAYSNEFKKNYFFI